MQTITKEFQANYEIKKSTFIAHIVPFELLEQRKKELKEEHPKARHVVWAYRVLNKFNQIDEYASDDGEPKGTAGVPVLNVMRGCDLINVALLVVRYFGGIKLGTGGLVRAYGASVNSVMQKAQLVEYLPTKLIKFHIPYPQIQRFEHFFENNLFQEGEKEFNENGAFWQIEMTKKQEEIFYIFSKEFEYLGFKILEK